MSVQALAAKFQHGSQEARLTLALTECLVALEVLMASDSSDRIHAIGPALRQQIAKATKQGRQALRGKP